ncbi:hypothetical protein [Coleofasciculus sp.]|uniref:hypothetical protein n=1 Tax=Coleofasciculus sp. TaxID=3100458 RepID=UPI003A1191B7
MNKGTIAVAAFGDHLLSVQFANKLIEDFLGGFVGDCISTDIQVAENAIAYCLQSGWLWNLLPESCIFHSQAANSPNAALN